MEVNRKNAGGIKMKKSVKSKLLVIASVSVFAVISVIAVMLIIKSSFVSSANESFDINKTAELKTGRYMHTSGDENKYVEVFDDRTIQIFGFDMYNETIERVKENYEAMPDDEKEVYINSIKEYTDWYCSRHKYTAYSDIKFVLFDMDGFEGGGTGFQIIDENTLSNNADNVYVYKR